MTLPWHRILVAFFLPPVGPLWLILAGALLALRKPRTGFGVLLSGLVTVVVLSLPAVANLLEWPFEARFRPLSPVTAREAGPAAIVVLGAGRNLGALEYGGETVSGGTLERLRYAARLARRTHLPVLVTGGKPDGGTASEGQLMGEALERDFGVSARWIESRAKNTEENAVLSITLLAQSHIDHILLVTDVAQMPRAKFDFETRGMKVTPAPMNFHVEPRYTVNDFIPEASAYARSANALREYLANIVVRLADHPHQ